MQRNEVLSSALVLLVVSAVSLGAAAAEVPAVLDKADFASRVQSAYDAKDVQAIGASMSRLYNDAGLSKAEALDATGKLLAQYDKVQTYYRVLEFKQFPDSNLGSIKAVLHIQGVPKGGREMEDIVLTFGYASVIFEDGAWKVYSTQEAASDAMSFNPAAITPENWPGWGTRLTIDEVAKAFGLMTVE